jgi:hypothetical protein
MKSTIKTIFLVLYLFSYLTSFVFAEGDARDYIAAPDGTKLMVVYYNHQTGNELYANGDKVSDDFNLNADITIFRPVIFTKIGPFLADPQMLIPVGNLSIDGTAVGGTEIMSNGLADPILTATFWLINKPEQKWWLGFTPYFFLPIGDYDHNKPVNLGENRWKFREEFATVVGLNEKTYLDLYVAGEFYLDNDDFGPDKVTMKQDPAFFAEAHLSYDITEKFYVAGSYFYKHGGETKINGLKQDNEASDHAVRATFGFWIMDNVQLLAKYRRDLQVENGPKTQSVEARLMYICF